MADKEVKKSKFEEAIEELLEGETLENARYFFTELRGAKISVTGATNGAWKIAHKGKGMGRVVWMCKDFWAVETYREETPEFDEYIKSENLQEIMWENIYQCRKCSPSLCAPQAGKPVEGYTGFDRTFFGRKFENTCKHWRGGVFRTPNKETIDCIKKVLEYKKQLIIVK
jgi:hypothetical protein